MTSGDRQRVYLDWNATAPLRPEARQAMLAAMEVTGNPSSVHAEGRTARAIVEKARAQVADLAGCDRDQVIFTSGATEAAAQVAHRFELIGAGIEHECVEVQQLREFRTRPDGQVEVTAPGPDQRIALQAANSETGVLQALPEWPVGLVDAVQAAGKIAWRFDPARMEHAIVSGHKIGGPKGVGALILRPGAEAWPILVGGGQERGHRSGTENVIGIAGFGAAAEAARRDVETGAWAATERLRDLLEETLAAGAEKTMFFGRESARLPNTSCFAVPGWEGETQVMQMDLAGFAVSAGSACSSGKAEKASRVLLAMGFDRETASSALRVSIGPTTREAEVRAFAEIWLEQYRRREARAA